MLDCRGMSCPQPVLTAKEQLEENNPETLEVLVDNQAAGHNVSRFLETRGYETEVAAQGEDFLISAKRGEGAQPAADQQATVFTCSAEGRRSLVFLRSETLGQGDDTLGAGLMKNFLLTLKEMGPELWRILMLNGSVKLTVEGSPVLDALKELEAAGVSILVCGTCLQHFGLLEAKQVGETTNMLDVVTSLQVADKVITV